MEEYAKADDARKPYIFLTSDHFTLVLPDLTYEKWCIRYIKLMYIPIPNGTEHDDKVLAFCYKRARKVVGIVSHLGLSDSTYQRKQVLGDLEKGGYLIKSEVSRVAYYISNPEMLEEQ